MSEADERDASSPTDARGSSNRWRLFAAGGIVLLLLALLLPRRHHKPTVEPVAAGHPRSASSAPSAADAPLPLVPRGPGGKTAPAAEEVVARKLDQFADARLALAEAMAARFKVEVKDDVRSFFAAVKRGDWEEIDAKFDVLAKRHEADPRSPDLDTIWRAILETYGAAEQVHEWPAQKLLDYGNGILAALRPGMVYVGGTDSGCFIPTFLNETSDGERHIVLTQNALADTSYLNYLRYLYGDQMRLLTETESKQAIDDYFAEAWKRRQHDDQFPDEPKQVRPGEDIKMVDGKINVSGQPAVWDINEKFLQRLLAKNPDLAFGYEESFPLKSTYADASPLGPIMELRAADPEKPFTAERAAETLSYWRDAAQQLLADPEAAGSDSALKTYSHTVVAQANLLAGREFTAEAEQTYRLASQLWPSNPEAVAHLSELLAQSGRTAEARQLFDDFIRNYPEHKSYLEGQAGWRLGNGPNVDPPSPPP